MATTNGSSFFLCTKKARTHNTNQITAAKIIPTTIIPTLIMFCFLPSIQNSISFSIYYFENIAVNIVNKNIIPIPIAGFNN